MNHYFNPVKICQGKGCLKNLPDLLQSLIADKGSDVLLIVWSECVLENEVIKALLNKQEGYKVHPLVFTASNPSVQDLFGVYEHTRKLNLGAVVGIGGGSVLDVAKSLCCMHDLDITDIDDLRRVPCPINFDLLAGLSVDMHGCAAFLFVLLDVITELGIHERLIAGLAAFLQVFCPEELFVDTVAEQLLLDVVEIRHPFLFGYLWFLGKHQHLKR